MNSHIAELSTAGQTVAQTQSFQLSPRRAYGRVLPDRYRVPAERAFHPAPSAALRLARHHWAERHRTDSWECAVNAILGLAGVMGIVAALAL